MANWITASGLWRPGANGRGGWREENKSVPISLAHFSCSFLLLISLAFSLAVTPVNWDRTKPDGTPRKLLDVSRLMVLGWKPQIGLRDGVRQTYAWYLKEQKSHNNVVRL